MLKGDFSVFKMKTNSVLSLNPKYSNQPQSMQLLSDPKKVVV